MFIVNIQDVRIGEIVDPQNPQQKLSTLDYLNRRYVLVQVFPLSGLNTAQNLWRHLTDDRSQVCLIIKENDRYSVWVENIQKPLINEPPDPQLEFIFRTQMCLIDSLWAEVGELLGQNQAAAFGKEILTSIPTITSLKELLAVITLAMQLDKSIDAYALSGRQLSQLYQDIQKLSEKYLGKNYARKLLADFQRQLSPRLNRSFQTWLLNHEQDK
jgi:hypothetical protein